MSIIDDINKIGNTRVIYIHELHPTAIDPSTLRESVHQDMYSTWGGSYDYCFPIYIKNDEGKIQQLTTDLIVRLLLTEPNIQLSEDKVGYAAASRFNYSKPSKGYLI